MACGRDVTDIEMGLEPQPLQHRGRDGKHLGITGIARIDQLDARLQDLALTMIAGEPGDRALVAEPDRPDDSGEAGRDDTRDLRCDIRPQRDALTGARFDEPDRGGLRAFPQAALEDIGALEHRRDQASVAPQLEHAHHLLGEVAATRSCARQEVANARRKADRKRGRWHGRLTLTEPWRSARAVGSIRVEPYSGESTATNSACKPGNFIRSSSASRIAPNTSVAT
ncbi:hypothetical protein BH11MYX1_BH11MYX1_12730 [soil metagenome]